MSWADETAFWHIDDIDWSLPSRLSVVLLDLGLWLEFLELGFYDSLFMDASHGILCV